MLTWQDFEIECANFLNATYGTKAKFINQGGSNSRLPDIIAETVKGLSFGMEAKYTPAQCGQFVLFPNILTRTFDYSHSNYTSQNSYTQKIINHMNQYFNEYQESGTKGKEIIFENCQQIFSNWVIAYYKNKNTKYFITNNFIIFPVEQFHKYFNITATYRVKRSGSSSVSKSNLKVIANYINLNFDVSSIMTEGTKLFVTANKNIHDTRFVYGKYEYMFSIRDDKYEIRKLSNTFNANVIFSINLKSSQIQEDLDMFEIDLK